jgi:ATP-dependent RNA helicase DHX57
MPNTNKGAKGGGGSKAQKGSATAPAVDSNTNDSKSKSKKSSGKATATNNAALPATDEGPKKPDTRTLISGSSSWTGKLPVNLLSEHCQKQKWEKPEYSMRRIRDGFLSAVTLKAVHPKTKETVILPPFDLPSSYQHIGTEASAVEARHFAATWALYRVSNMKNIHMMLPPKYRDLWKGDFPKIKKEHEQKGLGWLYEADPFLAKEEQDKANVLINKKKEESLKVKEASNDSKSIVKQSKRDYSRGWSNIPSVEMGIQVRSLVEGIVRKYAIWNTHGISMFELDRQTVLTELIGIGFRESHIQEAMDECKDREEVLEWLLVHVPEDDLPDWCLPENYHAGITFATGNLKKEAFLKKLSDAGYSTNLEGIYERYNGDEVAAMEALQNTIGTNLKSDVLSSDPGLEQQLENVWIEESDTLQSIYGDRYKAISQSRCSIELEISGQVHVLEFDKSRRYPNTPPIIMITSRSLPSYIKLSIYHKARVFVAETLLGQPMLFNLVDWLESEIPHILANPGKLKEITHNADQSREVPVSNILRKRRDALEHMERRVNWKAKISESIELHKMWKRKQTDAAQISMLAARRKLPAWNVREELVTVVSQNQVTIVSGATGSGKSTQSPQFILDDLIQRDLGATVNIICTQPRRVSALGLADRVSDERCSIIGEEVGYAIRGDSKNTPGRTKIMFVTTGVLLRRLQSKDGLADVTHVIIDEIHERTLDSDFLLALLRDLLSSWKDLKLILMSATLDAHIFQRYFDAFSVGMVEIEGRTFDVTDHYLDDVIQMTNFDPNGARDSKITDVGKVIQTMGIRINYELVAATARTVHEKLGDEEGSVLIFLPGVAEIDRAVNLLSKIPNVYPLPLHASLHPSDQKKVFAKAPRGYRKIIASTNVAETSITIDDCVAVIDSGRVKETSFDPQQGMIKLEEVWASQAACKQRRGRAGRVRPGDCYKLYTRKAEQSMAPRPEPEIKRVPLEQLCLSIYALGIRDTSRFLSKAITPPDTTAVETAIELLRKMNALDGDELTALGYHLSRVPADLRLAKLMIYGAVFNCLEACLTIAAILTIKSPFVSPQQKRDEVKAIRASFSRGHGDLIADLEAFSQWKERRATGTTAPTKRWCDENFLSQQTLFDIASNRTQFQTSLKEVGFTPRDYEPTSPSYKTLNANNNDLSLVRALVAGAFNPQIARIAFPDKKYAASSSGAVELDPEARTIKYFTQDAGRVFIHPSSTLFEAQNFPGNSVYMSFFSKMATSKTFIRDLTPFNAYSLLMFAGSIRIDTLGRGLIVDSWLRLRGWARIGVLVGRLRVILDEALARKLENPGQDDDSIREIVTTVQRLIEYDGMDR